MLSTIELCEGCEFQYHVAYITDDGVRLCFACYVALLKDENAELKKYLKHARDDKKIRLGEIVVLEAKVVELRELSKVRDDESASDYVERRIKDIFLEVAEHVGNELFELDHPAAIFRGSIRMTTAWKNYLAELASKEAEDGNKTTV